MLSLWVGKPKPLQSPERAPPLITRISAADAPRSHTPASVDDISLDSPISQPCEEQLLWVHQELPSTSTHPTPVDDDGTAGPPAWKVPQPPLRFQQQLQQQQQQQQQLSDSTTLSLSTLPSPAACGDDAGDWGWGDLPLELLSIIFDELITAPIPHPEYLKPKARSWSAICRVCRHWANAMLSTPIGVCLPAALPPAAVAWLCKVKLRGIEFSSPKGSSAALLALLSHPQLVGRSSATLAGCIDAPYDGTWTPASFPQLRTCAVHRCGAALPTFDIALVKGLALMEDLILASGFSHVINWADLPRTTQQVVWTCPGRLPSNGRPLTGHLTLTDWPSTIKLDSLVLEADHTLQVDPVTLTGHVSRIAIHVPYLFFSTPTPPCPSGGAWPSAEAAAAATVQCIAQSLVDDCDLVDLNISCFSLFAGTSLEAEMDSNALSTMLPDILEPLVTALLAAVRALPPSPNRPQLRISRGHEGLELSLSRPPPNNDGSAAVLLSWDEPGALEEDLPRLLLSSTPVCSIAFVDFVQPPDGEGDDEEMAAQDALPAEGLEALAAAAAAVSQPPPAEEASSQQQAAPAGPRLDPSSATGASGSSSSRRAGGPSSQADHGTSTSRSPGEAASSSGGDDGEAGATAVVDGAPSTSSAPAEGDAAGVYALLQGLTLAPAAAAAVAAAAIPGSRYVRPAVAAEAMAQRALLTSRCLTESSGHQLKEVTGLLLLAPPPSDPADAAASGTADDAAAAAPVVLRHTGCNCGFGARARALGLGDGKDGREGPGGGDEGGGVFLGPPLPPGVFRPLLAPYAHLSRVSLVTLTALTEQDVLPPTVVMVDFTAGTPRQRFSAAVVSNLLDMHSLTLRGYHSLDLAKLPAAAHAPPWGSAGRGLTLNIWDTPSARVQPLGHPDHDVLPAPGRALNLSVCLARGGPIMGGVLPPDMPPLAVDLGAWGLVALDVHIQCAAGAVLHLPPAGEAEPPTEGAALAIGGWPLVTMASVMFALDAVSRAGCLATVSCQFAEDPNAPQGGHVPTVHLADWPVARRLDLDMLMLLVHLGFMRSGWHVTGRRLHEQGAMLVSLHKHQPDDGEAGAAVGEEAEGDEEFGALH